MRALRSFVRFIRRNRAAVAITMAVMAVPLLTAATAAVDMSRALVARTVLQAAVDTAAASGAGAWGTSSSADNGSTVATEAFKAYAATVSNFAPLASGSPNISLICTGGSTACGTGDYATTGPSRCNNPCVFVTASVKLSNLLLDYLAPTTTVTVTAGAGGALQQTITGRDVNPAPGFGSAGDHSDAYVYAVQDSSGGSSGTGGWNFAQTPAPNQNCSGTTGTISLLPEVNQVGSTSCNYLFIADSRSSGTTGANGSVSLAKNQPIAFTFIDDTGGSGYTGRSTANTTQLVVSITNQDTGATVMDKTYEPDGYQVTYYGYKETIYSCSNGGYLSNNNSSCNSYRYHNGQWQSYQYNSSKSSSTVSNSSSPGGSSTCLAYDNNGNCTQYETISNSSTGTLSASAYCPAETLYGALSSGYGAPIFDNIDQYSSAPEVLGYPPTYGTNHALVPFLSSAVNSTNYTLSGTNYTMKVQAFCPNYSLSNTSISAPISSTYAAAIADYFTSGTSTYGGTSISGIANFDINIFSTAFPGATYSGTAQDGSGLYNGTSGSTSPTAQAMTGTTNNVYPPTISGCTPSVYTQNNNATTAAVDPWWNWNGSNQGNCGNETSANENSYVSGQPAYGNCALLIQPLGTAVPTVPVTQSGVTQNEAILPDYYLIVSSQQPANTTTSTIVALDPVWDGQTFTDLLSSVITSQITSIDANITVSGSTVTDNDQGPTFSSSGSITGYGYVPSSSLANAPSYKLTSGKYSGDYVIIMIPAASGASASYTVTNYYNAPYDFNPPLITSSQCYNPQKNGNASGSAVIATGGSNTPVTDTAIGDQNNGSAIDPVANPQLGAIICNSNPPETYALYWNDLGTYSSDDLGYWNAVFSFTCPVAGTSVAGGPTTLFQ